jgi:putative DNA primase/helicase
MTPEPAPFTPIVIPKTAVASKLTIEVAKPLLEGYGFTVFYTKGMQKAVNGTADGLAIAKDLTLEIVRIHPPLIWAELKLKNPALANVPAVYSPLGYVDIYYRCEVSGALEYIACDSEGFAFIETVSWSITVPTPGYLIDGSLKATPTITVGQRAAIMALFRAFDERPTVAEVSRKLLPAVKDIMPAEETGFPPLDDENLDLIYQTMKPTEDNVALIFEDRYKDELRYCEAWSRWLIWTKSHWKRERTLLAFDYSRRIARKVNVDKGSASPAKASFARGVEFLCRASRVFATETEQWDSNNWLLNTPAGTYDLQNGESHPHAQADYLTKCAHVSPEDKPHPIFDKFMDEITCGDGGLVLYLQRALGACLSGAVQDNFLLFWYGDKGQNGKNTLSELIVWILGDYADMMATETLMARKNEQHLTFLASLRGLRLALCSEVSEGAYWNEQRIKSLTGDGQITANYMAKDPFTFNRTHKHVVLGNHRPMLRIVDPAIRSRLHIVPFKAHFDEEHKDPQMGLKLRSEAPQILQWLISGHEKWMEDGRILKKCSAVQVETDSYFEAQSTNETWVADSCDEGQGLKASAKDLYRSYKLFKESRGEGVSSQTRWGEWMGQRYDKYTVHGYVFYSGISLKISVSSYDGGVRND